jgi:hypothetical protein
VQTVQKVEISIPDFYHLCYSDRTVKVGDLTHENFDVKKIFDSGGTDLNI